MANLTLDINAEIDKTWNFDIDETILLMQGGPYTKHLLEALAISDTLYKVGRDEKGRSFYVSNDMADRIRLMFLLEELATGAQKWIVHVIPSDAGNNGIFTFLNKANMIGKTTHNYRGVTITMRTLIKAGDGSIWRPTGHVHAGTKDITVRKTFDPTDPGMTLTDLDIALPPLSKFIPEV